MDTRPSAGLGFWSPSVLVARFRIIILNKGYENDLSASD